MKKIIFFFLDLLFAPFLLIAAPILQFLRKYGLEHFFINNYLLKRIGVFPIRNHYYEPRFIYPQDFDFNEVRKTPLELDLDNQLALLKNFSHSNELSSFSLDIPSQPNEFYVHNPNFGAGDAELYYLLIRARKPKNIIEVGSGFSTMVAVKALEQNRLEDHAGRITCIEPYEMPFLDQESSINLIRKNVELVDIALFQTLEENDILFIDSSHIIRPGNDLLKIYFEILPSLKKGVLIHIHDIFSPRHYPKEWLTEKMRFWNEQYLLEAFLHNNTAYQVLFMANHLVKSHYREAKEVFIHLKPNSEPSSFWMQKIN